MGKAQKESREFKATGELQKSKGSQAKGALVHTNGEKKEGEKEREVLVVVRTVW